MEVVPLTTVADMLEGQPGMGQKRSNVLPFHGNRQSMNLNPLILTNIRDSPYYRNNLTQFEEWQELRDEIYNKVSILFLHMEFTHGIGNSTCSFHRYSSFLSLFHFNRTMSNAL